MKKEIKKETSIIYNDELYNKFRNDYLSGDEFKKNAAVNRFFDDIYPVVSWFVRNGKSHVPAIYVEDATQDVMICFYKSLKKFVNNDLSIISSRRLCYIKKVCSAVCASWWRKNGVYVPSSNSKDVNESDENNNSNDNNVIDKKITIVSINYDILENNSDNSKNDDKTKDMLECSANIATILYVLENTRKNISFVLFWEYNQLYGSCCNIEAILDKMRGVKICELTAGLMDTISAYYELNIPDKYYERLSECTNKYVNTNAVFDLSYKQAVGNASKINTTINGVVEKISSSAEIICDDLVSNNFVLLCAS